MPVVGMPLWLTGSYCNSLKNPLNSADPPLIRSSFLAEPSSRCITLLCPPMSGRVTVAELVAACFMSSLSSCIPPVDFIFLLLLRGASNLDGRRMPVPPGRDVRDLTNVKWNLEVRSALPDRTEAHFRFRKLGKMGSR